jgi:putative FmdB family regulatory protein
VWGTCAGIFSASAYINLIRGVFYMPIYEYVCSTCGHRLEAWQKMSEPALTECPACQDPSLRKLISAAGINVKGGRDRPEPMCGAGACSACAVD